MLCKIESTHECMFGFVLARNTERKLCLRAYGIRSVTYILRNLKDLQILHVVLPCRHIFPQPPNEFPQFSIACHSPLIVSI